MHFRKKSVTKYAVCPKFAGRIGNQMFIYASSFAVALMKNMEVELTDDCSLTQIFNLHANIVPRYLFWSRCRSVKTMKESHGARFDRRIVNFIPRESISFVTYLQSYKYFENERNAILKEFSFKQHIRMKAKFIFERVTTEYNNAIDSKWQFVGVHVRRGDKIDIRKNDKRSGIKVATKEYLSKAVDWYESMYTNVFFVVISDDMLWTKKNMPGNIKVKYIENNPPEIDLAIITMCDHFIMTVGTFGWWAGWLIGGNVTYFNNPAEDDSVLKEAFGDYTDHFPDYWVGL